MPPLVTVNLGIVKAIHVATSPPTNINMLWYDDNIGIKLHKYFDTLTSTWKSLIPPLSPIVIVLNYNTLESFKNTSTLVPGLIYKITDRFNYQLGGSGVPNLGFKGDDRGAVYIQALSINTLSKEVIREMLVPKHYAATALDGNNLNLLLNIIYH